MTRMPVPSAAAMTSEQKEIAEKILSVPGRSLSAGPWSPLLRSPKLAAHMLRLGNYIRFKTSLSRKLNELAILITGREWTAQYEWYAHYKMAMEAGLAPAIADAIALDKRPEGMAPDEEAVYAFCTELHRTKRVSDATYAKARAQLSEEQIVDLIGIAGYYDIISMMLNVAEVPLPAGTPDPLQPLQR
jgi:4-carboxymuconolactone decarboxylase